MVKFRFHHAETIYTALSRDERENARRNVRSILNKLAAESTYPNEYGTREIILHITVLSTIKG